MMKFIAEMGHWSSVVGNSVHLIGEDGRFLGQIAIMCQDDRLREKDVQTVICEKICSALNADLCASGQQVRALMDAARELIDGAATTYRARNGRQISIEADDGERCYIVHSDLMHALEAALTPAPQPGGKVALNDGTGKNHAADAAEFLYKHGELTYSAAWQAIGKLTSNGFRIQRAPLFDGDEAAKAERNCHCDRLHPLTPAPDAAQTEAVGQGLKQRIYDLLRHYRQNEVHDEDGNGYPLVDALTITGHGIDMGEREIMSIADMLAGELAHLAAPAPGIAEAIEAVMVLPLSPVTLADSFVSRKSVIAILRALEGRDDE